MQSHFLSVAGFIIEIRLHQILHQVAVKQLMVKQIQTTLLPFLLKSKPIRIDGTIEVQDKETYKLFLNDTMAYAELSLYQKSDHVITSYHISFLQFMLLLAHMITNLLRRNSGFMLHASACLVGGKAHIFIGKEGAGKSTILKLLRSKFPPLCDDQAIIRKLKNRYVFYQNPYLEKTPEISKSPLSIPIGGIYLLQKAPKIHVSQESTTDMLPHYLSNLLLADDQTDTFFQSLFDFAKCGYPGFKLGFRPNSRELQHYFAQMYG